MIGTGLCISEEVALAVRDGRPVVALETAVLTHGLPDDVRWEVYGEMQRAVRSEGAVPAAVAVWDGAVRVGAEEPVLESLCGDPAAVKAGLADLPAVLARRGAAGTTVAATLWAAHRSGIPIFATGGIGGVHRGAERTFDISGDLGALARYPGCVVCSGAKALLDLPKTLEALQTLGVCTVGYRTSTLPAFVCADSGLTVQHRVDSPSDVVSVVRARDALGLRASVLIVNPPPPEAALDPARLEAALKGALHAAELNGVEGGTLTTFLLDELVSSTGGDSLRANRALLLDNAALAARIACCYGGPLPFPVPDA